MKDKASATSPLRLLREKQVRELVPFAHSTLWAMVNKGQFPSPVRLGERMVAWRSTDVEEFIKSLEPTHKENGHDCTSR
jgi:prophage regulatory protein